MYAFQIVVESLTVAFFGLLGIWAAVDRGHWFLRFTVVGLLLGATLLVPAYELILMFGSQILVILIVVSFARRQKSYRLQFTLETALLLMVLASVLAAVAVQLPEWQMHEWIKIAAVGAVSAYAALLSLWIVCGQPRLRARMAIGGIGLAILVWMRFAIDCFDYAVNNGRAGVQWQYFLDEFFTAGILLHPWFLSNVPTIALSALIMLSLIALGRASRWFNEPAATTSPDHSTKLLLVRSLLCLSALVTALPLGVILWKLATPEPLPVAAILTPNGYDDLIAAGTAALPLKTNPSGAFSMSDAQLGNVIGSLQPVLDRIDLGLSRECLADLRVIAEKGDTRATHRAALAAVDDALWLRYTFESRVGTRRQKIERLFGILRFTQLAYRGTGCRWSYLSETSQSADFALGELGQLLNQFDESECREIVRRLIELNLSHEPWSSKSQTQRLLDQRDEWRTRLVSLFSQWSGNEHYDWLRKGELRTLDRHRSLIVAYAIRAHYLTYHCMPPHLDSLVPEFLPEIPADPYGAGAMKMKRRADGIAIYSMGLDRDDDGGMPHPSYPNGSYDPTRGDSVWIISEADFAFGH